MNQTTLFTKIETETKIFQSSLKYIKKMTFQVWE